MYVESFLLKDTSPIKFKDTSRISRRQKAQFNIECFHMSNLNLFLIIYFMILNDNIRWTLNFYNPQSLILF